MPKFPLLDLQPVLQDCKIVVAVGEATDSNSKGFLTVIIVDTEPGSNTILTKDVSNLGRTIQNIAFNDIPQTGKIHPVIATLILETGEIKKDDEIIKLCS